MMQDELNQGRVSELDTGTCRQLLGSHSIGRLAFNADPSPEVLPVNYTVHDAILFRTGEGAKHDAAVSRRAATFEVDGSDAARRSGWSVMVHGTLDIVEVSADALQMLPQPLPGGSRDYLVRLTVERISGRRIPPEAGWALPLHVWRGRDASDLMG
ncbi:DNA-binding protein [Salinisphaera orenii MK-B5]|uniref:DNA-binding protein n=1 Tax=Salinisphaera orenii MK-B5 TaxID=856730 RepID=A0A423PP04_9GAMM|nr:pyridoxamine 5'-phosphate oxidase family protein [Salinisphaera orenii]ROO27261.1 DNA-binding protein [Salinisphaera orenii MK-B5]